MSVALGGALVELPERYGKWKSLHRCFSHRCHLGQVLDALTTDRDNQYLMNDSTVVRAHQQATAGKVGVRLGAGAKLIKVPAAMPMIHQRRGSGGGLNTKIHMLADNFGRQLRFLITPDQTGDITQAPALLDDQDG